MKKISKFITNNSKLIVIISILLLIPALIGYVHTKINYDILVYLPKDIETIKGQNILTDEFKTGAFSFVFVENNKAVDVLKLEEEAKKRNKLYNITGKRKRRSLVVMSDGSTFYSLLKAETIYKRLNKEGETEE